MLETKKRCGAPRKSPEEMTKRQNTTFRPDMIKWLDDMRRDGHPKARIIDKSLREYKEKLMMRNEAIRRDDACRAALARCHESIKARKHSNTAMLQLRTDLEGIYETEF